MIRLKSALPLIALGALTTVLWVLQFPPSIWKKQLWQGAASPGPLSQSHANLEGDCGSCHTPFTAQKRTNCVLCHANRESLLQRQSTAFHASISRCTPCHQEHEGRNARPTIMDHSLLAQIGLAELDSNGAGASRALRSWVRRQALDALPEGPSGAPSISALERQLDCYTCHAREDRHFAYFGKDCSACHGTASWSISRFRHPSPESRDCAQCHKAPPSHNMGHFKMVSAKAARQPKAKVRQCYKCHRSTAWTDIPGIGTFKHH